MESSVVENVPKLIHLMWFSGDEYPADIKICLDTWKKVLPEYEVKVWTKEMAMECDFPYVKEALQCRKWAFAADVIRLYALYKWGGHIYGLGCDCKKAA